MKTLHLPPQQNYCTSAYTQDDQQKLHKASQQSTFPLSHPPLCSRINYPYETFMQISDGTNVKY